jgi:hypothetical protein
MTECKLDLESLEDNVKLLLEEYFLYEKKRQSPEKRGQFSLKRSKKMSNLSSFCDESEKAECSDSKYQEGETLYFTLPFTLNITRGPSDSLDEGDLLHP